MANLQLERTMAALVFMKFKGEYVLYTFIYLYFLCDFKLFLAILQIGFVRAEAKKEPVVLEESEYKNAAVAAVTNLKILKFLASSITPLSSLRG